MNRNEMDNFEDFQAPQLHIDYAASSSPLNYFRTNNETNHIEVTNWYDEEQSRAENEDRRPLFPPPGPPFGPPPGPPPGPPYGPPPGPPYGPPFGPPPGPPPGPPFGPPYGPPFGPPPGPPPRPPFIFPLGPMIPIPIPFGVQRPAQPSLLGKNVFVVIQGGSAYPNATATYQIQYMPGLTIYQALLSTGVIQLADNGQLLTVSGVTISDEVKYALNINGQPVYVNLISAPVSVNDIITLELIYE